jgi:hypothetical protein
MLHSLFNAPAGFFKGASLPEDGADAAPPPAGLTDVEVGRRVGRSAVSEVEAPMISALLVNLAQSG